MLRKQPRKPLVLDIIRQREEDLFSLPNVIGYSNVIQKRIKNGRIVDEDVIRVYVVRKKPEGALGGKAVPKRIEGFKTDVVPIGRIRSFQAERTKKIRPVIAGISIGHKDITAGTLGWFAIKQGNIYFVSNAHVFTPDPTQPSGAFSGDEIYQPGPIDGGGPVDTVAYYDFHVQLKEDGDNYIDFAVARPVEEYSIRNFIGVEPGAVLGLLFAGSSTHTIVCKAKYMEELGYSFLAFDGSLLPTVDPLEDDITKGIVKDGRTSGFKGNIIVDESATVYVSYENATIKFVDQIVAWRMGEPGDSGSLVFLPSLIFNG